MFQPSGLNPTYPTSGWDLPGEGRWRAGAAAFPADWQARGAGLPGIPGRRCRQMAWAGKLQMQGRAAGPGGRVARHQAHDRRQAHPPSHDSHTLTWG